MCGPTAANKWLLSFGDLLASHKTSWGHSAFYSHPRKPWAEQTMGNTTAKHNKFEISQFLFIGSCVFIFSILSNNLIYFFPHFTLVKGTQDAR